MSKFKVGDRVILVNSGMEAVITEVNRDSAFPYKVDTRIGELYAGEHAMKLKRLNDATPEEWDATRQPGPWTAEEWDESRMDVIGQNGGDGLHYQNDGEFVIMNNTVTNNVSKPKHYKILDCEAIDMIVDTLTQDEFKGYCFGNILKYRLRAGKKGDALEDLAKADEYEKIYARYYGENND